MNEGAREKLLAQLIELLQNMPDQAEEGGGELPVSTEGMEQAPEGENPLKKLEAL